MKVFYDESERRITDHLDSRGVCGVEVDLPEDLVIRYNAALNTLLELNSEVVRLANK
jgi:hypothetical protein